MKPGDMVRFKYNEGYEVGLLIDYEKLMKTATILFESKVLRIRGSEVEKAGRKDFDFCEACGCTPCDCGFGS